MTILILKIASLFIIFLTGVLGGLSPLKRSLSERGEKTLMLGNAFAGGIFLGAGLLHMLPDAVDNFNTLKPDIDFPFPMLIAGFGFLLILLIEQIGSNSKDDTGDRQDKGRVYPLILFVVLSLHSIIAGTSLGLEGVAISALAIFIAIIAHKGAAGFALGVSLNRNEYSRTRHIKTIALFAAMTPLGVLLGTIFSTMLSGNAALMFEMIFDALAAGTFLYIAVAEIMKDVFEKHENTLAKMTFTASGFALMALIAVWA